MMELTQVSWFDKLGLVAWPLLLCSLVAALIIIERALTLLAMARNAKSKQLRQLLSQAQSPAQVSDELAQLNSRYRPGVELLLRHANDERSLRDEVGSLWLVQQRRKLLSGLKLLGLIGIVSPLLGLLGTVLGLIQMFADVATSEGTVTPELLAEGLGMAMYTTAVGLAIALPAIACAHLLTLWAERILASQQHVLNCTNLWLSGICVKGAV